jgi:lysophospholipase L1-like esterase
MKKYVFLFALALLMGIAVIGLSVQEGLDRTASNDPTVWEPEIAAFELEDQQQPPPLDATLFVGSSSIRMWHTLAEDMSPLVTIRRGFGGSRMGDVVHYADRLITRYSPRKVVIFVGSNDINISDQPLQAVAAIAEGLEQLLDIIHNSRADTEVFYIAITPTPYSWSKLQAVQAANARAEAVCTNKPRCFFIATEDIFLDEKGQPRKRLYQFDGLHLSVDGYCEWTQRIKPPLMTESTPEENLLY